MQGSAKGQSRVERFSSKSDKRVAITLTCSRNVDLEAGPSSFVHLKPLPKSFECSISGIAYWCNVCSTIGSDMSLAWCLSDSPITAQILSF